MTDPRRLSVDRPDLRPIDVPLRSCGVTSGRVFRRALDRELPRRRAGRGQHDLGRGRAGLPGCRRRGHRRRRRPRARAGRAARWPSRPGGSPTPTARPSRASRWRRTRPRSGPTCPCGDPAIYPVSGGSEAMETALKMARAYHLARGQPERWVVVARWGSYHGNTLGALDLSGRKPLRRPYERWLGRFRHVSAAYPYRAADPDAQALGTARGTRPRELDAAAGARGARQRGRLRGRADRRRDPRARSSRRPVTGRPSPRSAAATACCSSPTRS